MRCSRGLRALLLMLLLATVAGSVGAHKASDAYLQLAHADSGPTRLRVDVALRDLDLVVDIDADGDGKLVWSEVRAAWPALEAYMRRHLQIDGCEWRTAARVLERRSDGVYAALQMESDCAPAGAPTIRYSMLADVDPTHRGIARIEWRGTAPQLRVLVPQAFTVANMKRPALVPAPSTGLSSPLGVAPDADGVAPRASAGADTVESAAPTPAPGDVAVAGDSDPFQFLVEGVRHILIGYDHVLFLLCLLFPAVMQRTARGWQPVPRLAQAVWPVAGIVTAFTVAHSITLALAATGKIAVPSSVIEPAIAATIMLAAFDNIRPIFGGRRGVVTFVFGLIHGFGFAGVLAELELPVRQFAWTLLQFNLGLELGQVLIVVVVTAFLFLLRGGAFYPRWVIRGGSFAALAIGAVWLVERVADVSLIPL
ncbi:MAG: HupE/UreJ family protein [Proteobacteria bacterium]|nr:HupE/UreJ family protein [Burkholderiales bacterium]